MSFAFSYHAYSHICTLTLFLQGWQGEGTREDETSQEEAPQEQQETAVPQGEGVPQEGSAEGVPQEGTGEQKTFPVEEPAYADPQKIKREEFPGTSDLYTIPDKTNKKASEVISRT